jgi:hypothetical protein
MQRGVIKSILATALLVGQALAFALPQEAELDVDTSVSALVDATYKGQRYACKCYIGQSCWPSQTSWKALNTTVEGKLVVHIPPGAPCHNQFSGPLGTVNTYNAAKCAEANAKWFDEPWQ